MSPLSVPHLPFEGLGSEDALHRLADVLPDALFTIDVAGRVTYWNRAAERITGWSPAEAVGRDCSILAGDAVNGCACGVGPLKCGLAQQGRTSKTCTLRTKDGRLLQIVKSAVPLYAPDGAVVGALETFTAAGEPGQEARCDWRPARAEGDFCGLVGRHPVMEELYKTIGQVARSSATVMILGESGSGKECVAEAIHRGSGRSAAPFVRVSCSALNENLLESELFGHVKGAFTGALKDRRGRFQEAHGGTLLLDEIGDVSPAVQVKLLRVIEQREIERVGDSAPIKVDVRLLCATHRNLKTMVEQGRFRADLYFRLAVFPLRVPSLREHLDDLPLLAASWLERLAAAGGQRPTGVSASAQARLATHAWPGNVRELQNVLESAALRAGDGLIEVAHLPEELRSVAPAAAPPPPGAAGLDKDRVSAMLQACGWNRAEAARRLGVSRVTLWKRLKLYGLTEPDEAPPGD
ncbi:MAG: sigma 54-interacting transcriptional regulator [Anaeromyxobacter sp.]|nr:sigma 54-interacting transcriptional regulator [Anaeromyxobacter sp.]MBL0275958.1 sigma 54-interacting transcriptional regulator [Anaeromyxobacter sp.]